MTTPHYDCAIQIELTQLQQDIDTLLTRVHQQIELRAAATSAEITANIEPTLQPVSERVLKLVPDRVPAQAPEAVPAYAAA
ncbi:MAG TPA: hypothetical protein V6D06_20590 [Trichocoleus sp.]